MNKEGIARINELARKSRTPEGLTDEEKAEQQKLRNQFRADIKNSFVSQLDNTYVVDASGNKTKLIKEKQNDK